MKRREFIAGLAGPAVWPVAARAQQSAIPVIGFLTSLGRNDRPNLADAFRRGLSETGFVEGRDVAIEYRFAENQHDRLPAMAADLIGRKVAVIAATGGPNPVLAAKESTSTVPIVFTSGSDPVQAGFVTSLNRPGGNITGISWFGARLSGKALGLLHELIPNAAVFAMMVNPNNPESEYSPRDAQEAARMLGRQLLVLHARTPSEIDTTFATLRLRRASALLVGSDPFFTGRRQQIVALAARDAIPGYVHQPRIRCGWRADELWQRPRRCISSGPASMPDGFSRVPRRPTHRSTRRLSSSSLSTSRPQRRLALTYRRSYSPAPTR
jgi:putative tryptophan/tyrosine transport system substrate-binding protein